MATKEEYEKVYGPVPEGVTPATEWGVADGCFVVARQDSGYILGRWKSLEEAEQVYLKLAVSDPFGYKYGPEHHTIPAGAGHRKCRDCGLALPYADWPVTR